MKCLYFRLFTETHSRRLVSSIVIQVLKTKGSYLIFFYCLKFLSKQDAIKSLSSNNNANMRRINKERPRAMVPFKPLKHYFYCLDLLVSIKSSIVCACVHIWRMFERQWSKVNDCSSNFVNNSQTIFKYFPHTFALEFVCRCIIHTSRCIIKNHIHSFIKSVFYYFKTIFFLQIWV